MTIFYIDDKTETIKSEEYDVANLDDFLREMYEVYDEYFYTSIEDAEEALNELYPLEDYK